MEFKNPRLLTMADAPEVIVECKFCGARANNPEFPQRLIQCIACGNSLRGNDPQKRAAYGDAAHNLVNGLKNAIEASDTKKEEFPFKIWLQFPDELEPEGPITASNEDPEKLGIKLPRKQHRNR